MMPQMFPAYGLASINLNVSSLFNIKGVLRKCYPLEYGMPGLHGVLWSTLDQLL